MFTLPSRRARRSTLALVLASAVTVGLAACSSDDDDSGSGDTVTLVNAFEETDYPVAPERVVVTASALDTVLALGITPTAVVLTAQDEDAPWREGMLDGVERITVPVYGDIDVEAIAAADPDVIIGDVYWIESQEEYDKLSAIAPTLNGPSQDPTKATWKERITQLGALYDRADDAQKVIDDDAARFAAVKKELPGLAGKTGWVARDMMDGTISVSPDPAEASNSFVYDLGMQLPAAITTLPVLSQGGARVATENMDQLNGDFGVLYTEQKDALMKQPLFAALSQVKNNTLFISTYAIVIGLAQPSSLSREWVLDELRPTLDKVAAADPVIVA